MTWMNAAKLASDTYDLHCHEYSSMCILLELLPISLRDEEEH